MMKHRALMPLMCALVLVACGGGHEAAEGGHAPADAVQTAPNSMSALPAGDAARGRKIAETKTDTRQACADCHGPGGAKPIDASYPMLAGQYGDYLAHTLQMYRDKEREQAVMNMQAATLTDQDIADLAAYFEAQPSAALKDLSGVK